MSESCFGLKWNTLYFILSKWISILFSHTNISCLAVYYHPYFILIILKHLVWKQFSLYYTKYIYISVISRARFNIFYCYSHNDIYHVYYHAEICMFVSSSFIQITCHCHEYVLYRSVETCYNIWLHAVYN